MIGNYLKTKEMRSSKYSIECCDRLKELVKEDYMFSIMTNYPFTKEVIKPTLFILSDSGHGGAVEANYCPFCGSKLEFKKE